MIKYVICEIGEGTITHEDQEVNGLRFDIRNGVIQVNGDTLSVNEWIDRVKGSITDDKQWVKEIIIPIPGI